MDVEFDDIFSHWQNQFDALSDVSREFPGEILLDEYFPEIREEPTVVLCAGRSHLVNLASRLPSQPEPANRVPSSAGLASDGPTFAPTFQPHGRPASGAASLQPDTGAGRFTLPPAGLDVLIPGVVLQPTSIDSSLGSVTNSERWGQRGSCLTEELTSAPAKRKKQSAARVARKKIKPNDPLNLPVKQMPSTELRVPTLGEHILRERKRRDDMAEKFLLLEKILPPEAPRRQKSVIVEDTIKLVKSLQLRREELLQRRAQMKLTVHNRNIKPGPSPQHPRLCQSKRYPCSEISAGDMPFAASVKLQLLQVRPSLILDRRKPVARASVEKMAPLKFDASSCRELVQIHAQVADDEILVEMLFHQYLPHLHTRVMQTVETMKLDVIRGSMQRSVPCGFIECIINAKPRVECSQSCRQDTQSSARLLVGALQEAFQGR